MEDQLIKHETAKLAKEKGFDCITQWYFHPEYGIYFESFDVTDDDECEFYGNKNNGKWAKGYYSAPTQSLLQRWLREKYNINLVTHPLYGGNKVDNKQIAWVCKTPVEDEKFNKLPSISLQRKSYEEALEVGLVAGLKLI